MTGHTFTTLGFALLGLALIGLELAARLPGSRVPSVDALLRASLGRRTVQVLVVLSWWWVGWHFFADA